MKSSGTLQCSHARCLASQNHRRVPEHILRPEKIFAARGKSPEERAEAQVLQRRGGFLQIPGIPDPQNELGAGSGTENLIGKRIRGTGRDPDFMQTDGPGSPQNRPEVSGIANAVENQNKGIGHGGIRRHGIRTPGKDHDALGMDSGSKAVELSSVQHDRFRTTGRQFDRRPIIPKDQQFDQIGPSGKDLGTRTLSVA